MAELSLERRIEILANIIKANEAITYIDLHGKQYAEVKERIKAFRAVFPEGSIHTRPVEIKEDSCIFQAEVFNENGSLLATGHAAETKASSNINRTSMIENCETSAVGRALAMAGFGIKDGIASAQDIGRADTIKKTRDGMRLCRRCNHEIKDALDRKGNVIKAETIAQETLKVYGDTYCLSCAAEVKKAKVALLEVDS